MVNPRFHSRLKNLEKRKNIERPKVGQERAENKKGSKGSRARPQARAEDKQEADGRPDPKRERETGEREGRRQEPAEGERQLGIAEAHPAAAGEEPEPGEKTGGQEADEQVEPEPRPGHDQHPRQTQSNEQIDENVGDNLMPPIVSRNRH